MRPLLLLLISFFHMITIQAQQDQPLRIGVVGLTHTHVHWILDQASRGEVNMVGIVEPNRELAERYAKQYGYDMNLVYKDLETMLTAKNPEAVTAFNSIFDHLKTVEICAPKGIHVMVESRWPSICPMLKKCVIWPNSTIFIF